MLSLFVNLLFMALIAAGIYHFVIKPLFFRWMSCEFAKMLNSLDCRDPDDRNDDTGALRLIPTP